MEVPGKIIVLNGTPRSGKSSIAGSIQSAFDGVWMNLGVDNYMRMTPPQIQPGIGLRPGGERPDLEPVVVALYAALYEAIAAHSRAGLNVVVDVGHHDDYSQPRGILAQCARRVVNLPAWFVGVYCSLETIMARRQATGWSVPEDGSVPPPVVRWQTAVHSHGHYDLTVDTDRHSAETCAEIIRNHVESGNPPRAFAELARP